MSKDDWDLMVLEGVVAGPEVVNRVLPLVYEELRRLASVVLRAESTRHNLVTTELVHETYLRLLGIDELSYHDRRHFFAMAAVAMRRTLVDRARKRNAGKRFPQEAMVSIDAVSIDALPATNAEAPFDVLWLDKALRALERSSQRQAKVLELRYFAGLTEAQVAEALGLSRSTVTRDVRMAKRWLRRELRR